jgi:hypothetical protein
VHFHCCGVLSFAISEPFVFYYVVLEQTYDLVGLDHDSLDEPRSWESG